jgi:hypothetical protein
MISERITTGIAVAATASPWWLPSLATVSETAGLMLPVAGLVWLVVQIAAKITTTWRKKE